MDICIAMQGEIVHMSYIQLFIIPQRQLEKEEERRRAAEAEARYKMCIESC